MECWPEWWIRVIEHNIWHGTLSAYMCHSHFCAETKIRILKINIFEIHFRNYWRWLSFIFVLNDLEQCWKSILLEFGVEFSSTFDVLIQLLCFFFFNSMTPVFLFISSVFMCSVKRFIHKQNNLLSASMLLSQPEKK